MIEAILTILVVVLCIVIGTMIGIVLGILWILRKYKMALKNFLLAINKFLGGQTQIDN